MKKAIKISVNGVVISTDKEIGEKFVNAYQRRDAASNAMMVVWGLGPDHQVTLEAVGSLYDQFDDEVREAGRLILGADWDSAERKHETTAWRNLSSENVLFAD